MTDIIDSINSPGFASFLTFLSNVVNFIIGTVSDFISGINTLVTMAYNSSSAVYNYLVSNSGVLSLVQGAFNTVPAIFVSLLVMSILIVAMFSFLRSL